MIFRIIKDIILDFSPRPLKTKGWRFEDTRVIEPKRIEKLLVLLALGFVWAHKIGEWKASIKPIPLKKLRNQKARNQKTRNRC